MSHSIEQPDRFCPACGGLLRAVAPAFGDYFCPGCRAGVAILHDGTMLLQRAGEAQRTRYAPPD